MSIQLFGALLVLGVILFLIVSRIFFKTPVNTWIPYIVVGFIFARVMHVLQYYDRWDVPWLALVYWKTGGLNLWGALYGVLLTHLYIYRFVFIKKLHELIPQFALATSIISLAFISVPEGYGVATSSFLAMQTPPYALSYLPEHALFHPLFLYSFIFWLISFILLQIIKRYRIVYWWMLTFIWYLGIRSLIHLEIIDLYYAGIWLLVGLLFFMFFTRFKKLNSI
jgi:hypothetical protein